MACTKWADLMCREAGTVDVVVVVAVVRCC